MRQELVGIADSRTLEYGPNPPFHPPKAFPELPYGHDHVDSGGLDNRIYPGVREVLRLLELDDENHGTPDWNPLGELISPGDTVVIKPNFVRQSTLSTTDIHSVVTHGSVLRPLVDYCQIALDGRGELAIADAPQFDSDFDQIVEETGTRPMVGWLNQVAPLHVDLLDLRIEKVVYDGNVIVDRIDLDGDPKGYTEVDLGPASAFAKIEELVPRIYGADYDVQETQSHHESGTHEYFVANTILDADVILNAPKLKTHKKAGITVSLKNIIGINGNKNYLPHHRMGPTSKGGDEFEGEDPSKRVMSALYNSVLKAMGRWPWLGKILRIPGKTYSHLKETSLGGYEAGNWHGNDTVWRTILDLNKILFYGATDGRLHETPQRRCLTVVDGIIAGEREGPLNPSAKPTGLLLGGIDPLLVDITCARLMGFDHERIPQLREGLALQDHRIGGELLADRQIASNDGRWEDLWTPAWPNLGFEPHSGWKKALSSAAEEPSTPP